MYSDQNLISFLIPVYNSESTIARCLDSIVNQHSNAIEVVVIDDGSTDATYNVVLAYAEKFPYIRGFTQNNSGVSATRQKLIEKATGNYIMFCDADDYLAPDAIKTALEFLDTNREEPLDLIIFGYNLVRTSGMKTVKRRKLKPGIYSYEMITKNHVRGFSDLYWSALWNKCYKRDLFFEPDKVVFEVLMEDVICNVDVISRARHICISDCVIYNYVQIGTSITRNSKADCDNDIIEAKLAYDAFFSKALLAYPKEKIKIMEHAYRLNSSLLDRARKLNTDNLIKLIGGGIAHLEDELGARCILLDISTQLRTLKRRIRKIICRRV